MLTIEKSIKVKELKSEILPAMVICLEKREIGLSLLFT
jgi:hypothetical protein